MAKFIGTINDATILDLGAFAGFVLIVIDSSWLAFFTFMTFGIGFYIEERYGFVEGYLNKEKKKQLVELPVKVENEVFKAKASPVQETAVPPQRDTVEEISKDEESCQMELNRKESQETGAYEEIMRQYDQSSPARDDVEEDDCFRKISFTMKQPATGENVEEVYQKTKEKASEDEQEKEIPAKKEEIVAKKLENKVEVVPEVDHNLDVQEKSANASVVKPKLDESESTLSKVENLLRRSSSHSSVSSVESGGNKGDFAEEESTKSSGDFVKVTEELTKSSDEHVEAIENSTTSSESLEKIDPTSATEESVKEYSEELSTSVAEASAEPTPKGEPAQVITEKIIDVSDATPVPIPSQPIPLSETDQILEVRHEVYANPDLLLDVSNGVETSVKEPLESSILTSTSQATDKIDNSTIEGESQEISTKKDAADESVFATDSSSFNIQSAGPVADFTSGKDSIEDKSPSSACEQHKDDSNKVSDNQPVHSLGQQEISEVGEVTSVEGKIDLLDAAVEEQKEAVTDVYWTGQETSEKSKLSSFEDVVDKVFQKGGDGPSVGETLVKEEAQSSPTNNDPSVVDQPSKSEPGEVSAMVRNVEAVVQSKDFKDEAEFQ